MTDLILDLGIFFGKENVGEKSKKKWKLWRSSSQSSMKKGCEVASQRSDSSMFMVDDDYELASAMATVAIRAAPKDFMLVKQEWSAIRIQSVFRGFLVSGIFVTQIISYHGHIMFVVLICYFFYNAYFDFRY